MCEGLLGRATMNSSSICANWYVVVWTFSCEKEKTAYVKFFSMDGLGKSKQLVSLVDIFDLEYSFNEFVLGEDEPKRVLFSLIME